MKEKMYRCAVVLAALSITPHTVDQSTLGNIVGVVLDPSQAAVSGAVVKLRNLDDNSTHATLSVADGSFQFPNLKAGRYLMTVQQDGFTEFSIPSLQTHRQADGAC